MSNSEKLYEDLNKTFIAMMRIIKYAVYPVGIFIVVVSLYWGFDIRNSKNQIDQIKDHINGINTGMSLKTREIDVASKELEYKANIQFDQLSKQFQDLEKNYQKTALEYQALKEKYETALKQNRQLFSDLQADSKSLADFQNVLSKYSSEIEYAKKGAEQKKQAIEDVLKQRNEQLEAVNKSVAMLVEYLVLVQKGRSTFPDPNAEQEIN